ncbi:MAG TPA: hypothetical protein ENL03_00130 [Phycisphaerae bacterium]|nr:hypothetical protein [Phycisphaerae bacterium]
MTTRFEHAYVINILSDDHPGIVAAVGNAVGHLGGNIDSCSQTVLGGFFTLIMIVSMPDDLETDALCEEVRRQEAGGSDLQVMARKMNGDDQSQAPETDRFIITAFGKDTQGVVLRFSRYLASKDVNIVDLFGKLSDGEFMLISEVDIPRRWNLNMLQADLEEMGSEMGFTVRLQHENIFVATNQLRLPARPGDKRGN